MKQTVKWLAAALIALGLNQAVWAGRIGFSGKLAGGRTGKCSSPIQFGRDV